MMFYLEYKLPFLKCFLAAFLGMAAVLPSSAENTTQHLPLVAIGPGFSMIVMPDGTLWGWGRNTQGELGDGTFINRKMPTLIGRDYKQISATGGPTLAIKADGTLWEWGQEDSRGDNSVAPIHATPVKIGAGFTEVTQGTWENVAVNIDGTLYGWGGFNAGCGLGLSEAAMSDQKRPATPTKLDTGSGYRHVVVGKSYTIALKTDGTLWAWGVNEHGELGRPEHSKEEDPFECFPVRMIGDGFLSVATDPFGFGATLAVKKDGTLWGWGSGMSYELMDKYRLPVRKPVLLDRGFVLVSTAGGRAFGVKADGSLWGWGENKTGYLGDGSKITRKKPVKLGDDYAEIVAGEFSAIAIKKDGSIWTWGENGAGELGDGTTIQRMKPVRLNIR